ncbi:hypothetical protein [Amorphus coralli]|uniref:hypothetical protein n=1 Tax=Amorphus coralli TaxID=340680 RepID=UPI0003685424|nr:hypothetical protein [Amorphus coralli]
MTPRLFQSCSPFGRLARVTALASVVAMVGADIAAAAQVTVYTKGGAKVVIDTNTITQPVMYYTAVGAPYWVYPAHPAYVPGPVYHAPVYGPAGVNGTARRTARRTTRRVDRRW